MYRYPRPKEGEQAVRWQASPCQRRAPMASTTPRTGTRAKLGAITSRCSSHARLLRRRPNRQLCCSMLHRPAGFTYCTQKAAAKAWVGSHHCGSFQGSKGHNQFEQKGIVRFEMPYNMWCGSCKVLIGAEPRCSSPVGRLCVLLPMGRTALSHAGRGTRFNSDKLNVGKYFSTTIWAFRTPPAHAPSSPHQRPNARAPFARLGLSCDGAASLVSGGGLRVL